MRNENAINYLKKGKNMEKLKLLAIKMNRKGIDGVTFNVIYNTHEFSCVFILGATSHQLYMTTVGVDPKTIFVEIGKDFATPNQFKNESYNILKNYLEFKFTSGKSFIPIDFFKEFDNKIDINNVRIPKLSTIVSVVGKGKRMKDTEKIYFVGWKRNAIKQQVSDENYIKTCLIVGEKVAKQLRISNISSCWSDLECKEQLHLISNYKDK